MDPPVVGPGRLARLLTSRPQNRPPRPSGGGCAGVVVCRGRRGCQNPSQKGLHKRRVWGSIRCRSRSRYLTLAETLSGDAADEANGRRCRLIDAYEEAANPPFPAAEIFDDLMLDRYGWPFCDQGRTPQGG